MHRESRNLCFKQTGRYGRTNPILRSNYLRKIVWSWKRIASIFGSNNYHRTRKLRKSFLVFSGNDGECLRCQIIEENLKTDVSRCERKREPNPKSCWKEKIGTIRERVSCCCYAVGDRRFQVTWWISLLAVPDAYTDRHVPIFIGLSSDRPIPLYGLLGLTLLPSRWMHYSVNWRWILIDSCLLKVWEVGFVCGR